MKTMIFSLVLAWLGTANSTDCVKECQQRNRDKVRICDDLFNSQGSAHYHNTEWHKDCLAQAKTEFDNCLSICQ